MKHQQEKLDYLKGLIIELKNYHGGRAAFVKRCRYKTKRKFHPHFPNRILKDKVKFKRGLFHYLDAIIEAAEEALASCKRRENRTAHSKFYALFQGKTAAGMVEQILRNIKALEQSGKAERVNEEIAKLSQVLEQQRLHKNEAYVSRLLHQVFDKL